MKACLAARHRTEPCAFAPAVIHRLATQIGYRSWTIGRAVLRLFSAGLVCVRAKPIWRLSPQGPRHRPVMRTPVALPPHSNKGGAPCHRGRRFINYRRWSTALRKRPLTCANKLEACPMGFVGMSFLEKPIRWTLPRTSTNGFPLRAYTPLRYGRLVQMGKEFWYRYDQPGRIHDLAREHCPTLNKAASAGGF
jgi:hypothetical protein